MIRYLCLSSPALFIVLDQWFNLGLVNNIETISINSFELMRLVPCFNTIDIPILREYEKTTSLSYILRFFISSNLRCVMCIYFFRSIAYIFGKLISEKNEKTKLMCTLLGLCQLINLPHTRLVYYSLVGSVCELILRERQYILSSFILLVKMMIPIFCSLIFHAVIIKLGVMKKQAVPIDQGTGIFGDNKTFRGFIEAIIGCAFGFPLMIYITDVMYYHRGMTIIRQFIIGSLLGLAIMLSELPNSFIKRRMGIPSGVRASFLTDLIDQIDIMLGFFYVYSNYISIDSKFVLFSCCVVFFIHKLVTKIAYSLGVLSNKSV
jgi:hypothetical protein